MINPAPSFFGERQGGFVCLFLLFLEFRSQLIRNIRASSTQLCKCFSFCLHMMIFPYFFRKTNAEQRLGTNLGINVNIHSVETQPKAGPFSVRYVFVSNVQRAGEALTQLFGGGSRLHTHASASKSQLCRVSLLRILVYLVEVSEQK